MRAISDLEPIAVAGASGFIGRQLVRYLVSCGCRPTLLVRSRESLLRAGLEECGPSLRLELLDAESIDNSLREARPRTLFHAAGVRDVAPADAATAFAAINVCGTVRLLEAARRAGVERIVQVGSADVFGAGVSGPISEDQPLAPRSAYGVSMAAASQFAQALHARNGCPVTVVRLFTVYGPEQPPHMFVAQAVQAGLRGLPFRMTAGAQRRDLVFIDDAVRALVQAARAPGLEGSVLHVGSGQAHALRDVARLIWKLSGSIAPLLIGARPAPPEELHDTWADITRARSRLRWRPQVSLEAGLARMLAWARTHPASG